jgi:hypothetical protein
MKRGQCSVFLVESLKLKQITISTATGLERDFVKINREGLIFNECGHILHLSSAFFEKSDI